MVMILEDGSLRARLKNAFSKPKNILSVAVLTLVAIAIPITGILNSQSQDIQQEAAGVTSNSTPLGFGSQVAYDLSNWRCDFGPNPNDQYVTGNQQTYSVIYQKCKSQFFSDIDELARNNVKAVRIAPYLYQFTYDPNTQTYGNLNSNINNLDEIINRFNQKGIKVHMVLNSVYTCGSTLPGAFDYKLFTDPTLQTQYLNGLSQFIGHYRNSSTVISYDMLNEVNSLIENAYADGTINQPTVCMTANKDQIKTFLAQMLTTAKAADKQGRSPGKHKFTFSLSLMNNSVKDSYLDLIGNVDIYDIHMYIGGNRLDNPAEYYKDFPTLNKPIIHGEIGVDSTGGNTITDGNGKRCDSYPFEPGHPWQATGDCQQKLLFNTKTWTEKAKARNIDAFFFHNWNNTNRFVFRTYVLNPTTGNFDTQSYQYSLAGNYINGQNNGGGSGTGDPNIPMPTPNFSVIPPAATYVHPETVLPFSVKVAWIDNAINETYYRFAYTKNTTPQQWTFTNLDANATSHTISTLSQNTQYYFAVIACNTVGCSNAVHTDIVTTQIATPTPTATSTPSPTPNYSVIPARPINFSHSNINNTSIQLNWADTSNETYYDVAYTINKTPQQWTVIPNITQNSNKYTVGNLVPNTPYYFGVRACNTAGCSAYMTGQSVSTLSSAASSTPTLTPTPTVKLIQICDRNGCFFVTPTPTQSFPTIPFGR